MTVDPGDSASGADGAASGGGGGADEPWVGDPLGDPYDDEPFDPDTSPPDGDEAWLADLPADRAEEYMSPAWTGAGEGFAAGFLHHEGGPAGVGFAAGGPLDRLEPGPVLAGFLADAAGSGPDADTGACAADPAAAGAARLGLLSQLGESELVGVLCAARRMASWAAAQETEAVIALARRRSAQAREPGRRNLIEHVSDEVAAALTLTGRSAARVLDIGGNLARLPAVRAAALAGAIDWPRAVIFADVLSVLPDADAAAIADLLLGRASGMTTARLRVALRRAILTVDPGADTRRRRKARKDASVDVWEETSGNSVLAGRELPKAEVIAADARLTAQAKWLQARGATGTLQQLRAAVFSAVLNGRPITALLPAGPAGPAAPGTPGAPQPGTPGATGASPGPDPATADPAGTGAPDAGDPVGPAITGNVNLTLPLTAYLGQSDRPGEIPGHGAADAETCRALAAWLAAHPATRWCLTLTDPEGRAVAHACSPTSPGPPPRPPGPPGPPGPPHPPEPPHPPPDTSPPTTHRSGTSPSSAGPPGSGSPGSGPPRTGQPPRTGRPPRTGPPPDTPPDTPAATWLARLRPVLLETGDCTHAREFHGYRPPASLRHLITIRQPTCDHPGCRRPATRCDLDHAVPYAKGGRTCECNLGPRCRRHHRAKQTPGWHLEQPTPGTTIWTMPHGRSYTTQPDTYPV